MKPVEIKQPALAKKILLRELNRNGESKFDLRLVALLLLANGISTFRTARILAIHQTTVQRWAKNFNDNGTSGLKDETRPGRPSTIPSRVKASLEEDFLKSPAQNGHDAMTWTGRLVVQHLRKKYGMRIGIRQSQRLYQQLGGPK
jgi:transposase